MFKEDKNKASKYFFKNKAIILFLAMIILGIICYFMNTPAIEVLLLYTKTIFRLIAKADEPSEEQKEADTLTDKEKEEEDDRQFRADFWQAVYTMVVVGIIGFIFFSRPD